MARLDSVQSIFLGLFGLFLLNIDVCTGVNYKRNDGQVIQMNKALIKDVVIEEELKVDAPCAMCKLFVEKVEKTLEQYDLPVFLNKTLFPECFKLLNDKLKCDLVIAGVVAEVQKMIATYTPEEACEQAKLCQKGVNSDATIDEFLAVNKALESRFGNGTLCNLCMTITKTVDTALSAVLANLKNVADFICNELPDEVSQECLNVADQAYNAVVDLLINQLLDPDTVCSKDLPLC